MEALDITEDDPREILKQLKLIRDEIKEIKNRVEVLEEETPTVEAATIIEKEEVIEKIEEIEAASAICKKCGIEYDVDAKFCGKCGSKLELIAAEEAVDEDKTREQEETEKPEAEAKKKGFELDLGRKWLNKIGVISIVLGIAFFVKYSVEQGYIGPIGKIIVSITAGLALLVAGEIFNRKEGYLYLARSLTGGSFAVLYITIYATHHFYNLMPKNLNLIVLGVLVVLGVIFSLKYNSKEIASEAFLLGYIITLMSPISPYTLMYTLVLTLGLIIVTVRRKWTIVGVGGLAAAYIINFGFNVTPANFITSGLYLIAVFLLLAYLVHSIEVPDTQGQLAILGLVVTYGSTLMFPSGHEHIFTVILFLGVFLILFNILSFYMKKPTNENNILMLLLNAFFFAAVSYIKAINVYGEYAGLLTISIAVLYLILTQIATRKRLASLSAVFLTLSITFVTITIPIQVNRELITIAWAIEALLLLLIGIQFDIKNLRYLGNGVAVVTFLKTIMVDTSLHMFDANNILASTRAIAYMAPIITFLAAAVIYHRNQEKYGISEKDLAENYLIGSSALLILLLFLELAGWHVTGIWAIIAYILFILGFRYAMKNLRLFTTGVAAITIGKVVFQDVSLRPFALDNILSYNSRFLAFIIPITVFYASYVIYKRNKANLEDWEKNHENYFTIAIASLLAYLLALELKGGYISAAWATEAIMLLIIGFHYKQATLRQMGMALLAITTLKVFLIDVASLETVYRILSFIVLGIILLIASYAYSRYRHILEEESG